MQNAECGMQNAKCRMQNAECRMQNQFSLLRIAKRLGHTRGKKLSCFHIRSCRFATHRKRLRVRITDFPSPACTIVKLIALQDSSSTASGPPFLAAARSHSREKTQLFSYTLVPLRYPQEKAKQLSTFNFQFSTFNFAFCIFTNLAPSRIIFFIYFSLLTKAIIYAIIYKKNLRYTRLLQRER